MSAALPPPITFSSIQGFQNYFKEHNTLSLRANQTLLIRNITILTQNDPINKADAPANLFQGNPYRQVNHLINQILHPLGKTLRFAPSQPCDYSCTYGEDFQILFKADTVFHLENGPIYTRLTDLFKLMIASATSHIVFAPNQSMLLVGLRREEINGQNCLEQLQKLLETRRPLGLNTSLNVHTKVEIGVGDLIIGESTNPYLSITGKEAAKGEPSSFELSLNPSEELTFGDLTFWQAIRNRQGVLTIPPGRTLTLDSIYMQQWACEWQELGSNSMNIVEYLLMQLTLPLGKKLLADKRINFNLEENLLKLGHPEGFSLSVGSGSITTNLSYLGTAFAHQRLTTITLEPNQPISFLIENEEEAKELELWSNKNNERHPNAASHILSIFLNRHGIGGYEWEVSFPGSCVLSLRSTPSQKKLLTLSSSHKGTFKLTAASHSALMTRLLCVSPYELTEGLLEQAPEALTFLLFRAIAHYCYSSFHDFSHEPTPNFFSVPTQKRIKEFTSDREFIATLRMVLENEELKKQLALVLILTPEDFDRLNKDDLPPPVSFLITKVLNIAYSELRGSPFLKEGLRFLIEQLNAEGSVLHDTLAFKKAEKQKALQEFQEAYELQKEVIVERGHRSLLHNFDVQTWDQVTGS